MASSGTTSTRKRFTGAEFIVHFLEQQGIKIVTGIPGGSILCQKAAHHIISQVLLFLRHFAYNR